MASKVTQSQQPLKGKIREGIKETRRKYAPKAKEAARRFFEGLKKIKVEGTKKQRKKRSVKMGTKKGKKFKTVCFKVPR